VIAIFHVPLALMDMLLQMVVALQDAKMDNIK
jgi:hypothetical protein